MIFNRQNQFGLEPYFQHAIHLITTKYEVTKTSPQNFNFIFKDPSENDIFDIIFQCLPYVICFLSLVIIELFDEMNRMDKGSKKAFRARAILGMHLVEKQECCHSMGLLRGMLENRILCENCRAQLRLTVYNAIKILFAETFRCTKCRRHNYLPFTYLFSTN